MDISITLVKIPILMILSFTSFLCKGLPQLPVHTCLSISVISFHCCITHCHTHSDLGLDQNSGRGWLEPVLRAFLTRLKSRSLMGWVLSLTLIQTVVHTHSRGYRTEVPVAGCQANATICTQRPPTCLAMWAPYSKPATRCFSCIEFLSL